MSARSNRVAFISVFESKKKSQYTFDDYFRITHDPDSGKNELTNSLLDPIDWAALDTGGEDYNEIFQSLMEEYKVPTDFIDSWRFALSAEVDSVIASGSDEAYVIAFAERHPEYKLIYFLPPGEPSPLFQKIAQIKRLPIKLVRSNDSIPNVKSQDELKRPDESRLDEILKKKYLYFPHHGIYYGDLYIKDWPFEAVNTYETAVIEWGDISIKNADYYKEHGILWTTWELLARKIKGKMRLKASSYFMALGCNGLNFNKAYVVGMHLYRCALATQILRRFTEASVAFIGYEILFPPYIAQGLRDNNMPTVAVESRPIWAFAKAQNTVVDHLIVSSEENIKAWTQKKITHIKDFYNGGHLPKRGKPIKENIFNKFILVLDFHADMRWSSIANLGNYLSFYKDMLAIARQLPQYNFLVRTKEYSLDKIDLDLESELNTLANFNWDTRKAHGRSNRLMECASMVFGRQTSLMDEALSLGLPVLVYDKFKYAKPHLSRVSAKYASRFDVADSVLSAVQNIDDIMRRKRKIAGAEADQLTPILQGIVNKIEANR